MYRDVAHSYHHCSKGDNEKQDVSKSNKNNEAKDSGDPRVEHTGLDDGVCDGDQIVQNKDDEKEDISLYKDGIKDKNGKFALT